MTFTRSRRLLLIGVMLGALITPTTEAAASGTADPCFSGPLKDRVPVVLVHGFNSGPGAWGMAPGTDIKADASGRRFCRSWTRVEAFDYGLESTSWVTDPHVGQALAKRIDALARESRAAGGPGKVVLIAHSMGGLAIRCALDEVCGQGKTNNTADAGKLAADVATVVTFGTPNLGTFWKAKGLSLLADVAGPELSAACQAAQRLAHGLLWASLCDTIKALGTSDAGAAFTPGSREQVALKPWPAALPAVAVAGKITVSTSLFFTKYQLGDLGDGVVGVASAVDGAGTRPRTVDCGAIDLAALKDVVKVDIDCWHGSETKDARFLDIASQALDKVRATLPLNTHTADLRQIRVPAALCDTTHDFTLHNGAATSIPSRFGPLDAATTGSTVFGDLDGDGRDEVATDVYCNFQGGNGIAGQGYVVLTGSSGTLAPIGVVTVQYQPPQTLASAVDSVVISHDRIESGELWLHPDDPFCCPNGHATTTWTFTGGKLVPGRPRLTP